MSKAVGFMHDTPDTPELLTVWIRAGGPSVKKEIAPFVIKVLQTLPTTVAHKVLVCTNENDVILEELETITKTSKKVEIVFSKLSSFHAALTTLANHTDPASNVLTLSVGIEIRQDQIETGLKSLVGRVKVYGWQVEGHGNDGSCPGKGWYNTAALLHTTIVKQIQEELPNWIDNGVLGKTGPYTIGGNEEVPIMVQALQKDPKAQFILNTHDRLFAKLETGTGISSEEKLARKTAVGKVYMEKLHQELNVKTELETWSKETWASLITL